MNRAYSSFTVKAVDKKTRTVKGIATTPNVDRVGDIVDPLGVKFAPSLPFLWQHNHDQPIGTCEFEKPTAKGINFSATIASISEPGVLKDRTDEAWQSIESGLVRAVSIGFRPISFDYIDRGGVHFKEIEIYELSAVTIPANSDCSITSIKHFDAVARYRGSRIVKLTDAERAAVRKRLYGDYSPEECGA